MGSKVIAEPQSEQPIGPVTIPLTPGLELRLSPMPDMGGEAIRSIDLRLHRRLRSDLASGAFLPTAAGFRVRLDQLEPLIDALKQFTPGTA